MRHIRQHVTVIYRSGGARQFVTDSAEEARHALIRLGLSPECAEVRRVVVYEGADRVVSATGRELRAAAHRRISESLSNRYTAGFASAAAEE